jgi:phosphoribosylanthranilate isomerase
MGLRTLVKVSEINNLSDARYCAGMGVEMAGFVLQEGHSRYVSPDKIKDFASWIAGISLIGEFPGPITAEEVKTALDQLPLAGIQTSDLQLKLPDPAIILIRTLEFSTAINKAPLPHAQRENEFLLLTSDKITDALTYSEELKSLCATYKVLLGFGLNNDNIDTILNEIKPHGIALQGGDEVKPGMRDFAELSELLEILEIEN